MSRNSNVHEPLGQVLIPKASFSCQFEGADHTFNENDLNSAVREGHAILRGIEHMFKPITPRYEVVARRIPEVESATAAPGEKRGA